MRNTAHESDRVYQEVQRAAAQLRALGVPGLVVFLAACVIGCRGVQAQDRSVTTAPHDGVNVPGASSQAPSPATESGAPARIDWLVYHDIQPLHGGRALYVVGDGAAIARIASPPSERRVHGRLSQERLREIARALHDADFLRMTVPDRPGIPDEARATLLVRFASGQERQVHKWDGVQHEGFAALGRRMRALTEELERGGSAQTVRFDPSWGPEGPWGNPLAPR